MAKEPDKTVSIVLIIQRKIAQLLERFIDFSTKLDADDIEIEKKEYRIIRFFSVVSGNIYHFIKNTEEYIRVWTHNFINGLSELGILYETLYHSRHLLVILILLLSGTFSFFLAKGGVINFADKNLITNLLTAYVGGATAILGIVFALYSVGFQLTTEHYSSIVTDYLNREKVGQFFFKLLVLTTIFSLFNLLFQQGTNEPIIPPFLISTFFITTSIVGILVFKDDYMTKLKPKQVFERIYWQNMEAIRLVNLYNYPEVKSFRLTLLKNIKSFKLYLPVHKSWSVIGSLQKQVNDRLDILESFYSDLVREGKIEDATFGIVGLGYFLAEYLLIKHFIERGYGWWFPIYQEVVTSKDMSMFPVKANYESMGIGRLGVDKKNYDWLENRVLSFLEQIQNNTDFHKNTLIGNALTTSYEIILAGRYTRTRKGLEKNLKGSYESQNFEIVDKVFPLFISLGEKLAGIDKCQGNYINSFGQVKTTFVDGFSPRPFPGRLESWRSSLTEKLGKLYKNQKAIISREEIIAWKLPAYFYSLLVDFREQLKVETEVEGVVITPKKWLTDEGIKRVGITEQETLKKYQRNLVASIIKLTKTTGGNLYTDYFGGVILSFFNQLIYQERWAELESITQEHSIDLLSYFSSIQQKKFLEQELRDYIDLGLFEALVAKIKQVYSFYLRLFILAQIHISSKIKQNDLESLLVILRRPLMLGGLAYLVSELDQNSYYVIEATKRIERLHSRANLADMYDLSIKSKVQLDFDASFRIGLEEANRYRLFYRRVINSIEELPKDYILSGGAPYGIHSEETVKHPSQFVRKMASFRFSDMEECFEGYVEWLQKRNLIKKLITVIQKRKT